MLLKCIVLFRVYNKVQLNPSLQYIEPIPLKSANFVIEMKYVCPDEWLEAEAIERSLYVNKTTNGFPFPGRMHTYEKCMLSPR